MILTTEQRAAFAAASEPLMKWLSETCHPHTTVLLTSTRAELVEGVMGHVTDKFIKD